MSVDDIKPLFPTYSLVKGKHFPTPIFREIAVRKIGPEHPKADTDINDLEIDCNLSLIYTVPPDAEMSIEDMLEHYLDDLYLYVYLSPFHGINTRLENGTLNIRDLMNAYKRTTPETFFGPGHLEASPDAVPMADPLYDEVIAFQKQYFVDYIHSEWQGGMKLSSDEFTDSSWFLGYSKTQIANLLDNPTLDAIDGLGVNVIYAIFWGTAGEAGRWIDDGDSDIAAEVGTFLGSMPTTGDETRTAPAMSFMRHFLSATLRFFSTAGYVSDDVHPTWRRKKLNKIHLWSSDDSGGGYISTEGSGYTPEINDTGEYDDKGNKIYRISNIKQRFYYNTHKSDGTKLTAYFRLEKIEKLFAIAFVGFDTDVLAETYDSAGTLDERDTSFGFGTPYITSTSTVSFGPIEGETESFDLMPRRPLFNSYFGNIVFEHVLKNGVVPHEPREAFYKTDGQQYLDVAIEAWNSRYYVNEPVGRKDLEKQLKSLIKTYKVQRAADEQLSSNLKNLEYILKTYEHSANILMKMRDYMRTYDNKSPISNSGKFYNNFKLIITNFNKTLMTQEEVVKRMFKSTVVYDGRSAIDTTFMRDFDYTTPYVYASHEMGSPFQPGTTEKPGSGYLPDPWFRYNSLVRLQYDGSALKEESEWWHIYEIMISLLTGGKNAGSVSADGDYDSGYSAGDDYEWERFTETGVEYNDTADDRGIDHYFASGDTERIQAVRDQWLTTRLLTWEDITRRALDQTNQYFRINSEYSILGIHDWWDGDGFASGGMDSLDYKSDRIVENTGHFFFDWEKAVHTWSALAHFVSIGALQRFLGWRIPYKSFYVVAVNMIRRGIKAPWAVSDKGKMSLECWFDSAYASAPHTAGGTRPSYPESIYCIHDNLGSQNFSKTGRVSLTNAGGSPAGSVSYHYWTSTAYLKFVNFDVMNGDINTGLRTLRNFAPMTPELPFMPIALDTRVGGDYRLMAFEFKEFMDDDYAYYNFYAGNKSSPTSNEENAINCLSEINEMGEPFGQYKVAVAIEDRSLENIKWMNDTLVKPMKARYEEYVAFATELCSYNNIENRFNTFFAEAMEARYGSGIAPTLTTYAGPPAPQPPWFEVAYFIAAFMRTFGEKYYSSDMDDFGIEESILATAVEIGRHCNPRTGTLTGLEVVADMLEECQKVLDLRNESAKARIEEIVGIGGDTGVTIESDADLTSLAVSMTGNKPTAGTTEFVFNGGILPTYTTAFYGNFTCDQPIFGDIILDGADLRLDTELLEPPVEAEPEEDPEGTDKTCFVAGTVVKMYDGSEKNIEDVEIGDILLGEDNSPNTVLEFDHPMLGSRQLYSINDGKPFVTRDHPMKSTDGWKSIYPMGTEHMPRVPADERLREHGVKTTQLCAGDSLIKFGEQIETVVQLIPHDAPDQRLYNFILDGNHTYYADDYLVHNVCEGPSGGFCFVAGTKVTIVTDKGISEANIEELKIGDRVLTYNFETQKTESATIVDTMAPLHDDIVEFVFSNGTRTKHTHDHPYYVVDKGWCSYRPKLTKQRYQKHNPELSEIPNIELGDNVTLVNGENAELVEINLIDSGVIDTYNINVDANSNYFADGILVHNKGTGGGGGFEELMKECADGTMVCMFCDCPGTAGETEIDWTDIPPATTTSFDGDDEHEDFGPMDTF